MIVLVLELAFIIGLISINKRYIKFYFILISLVLSYIAYNFVPSITMDLTRHYETIRYFKISGWEGVKSIYYFKSLPLSAIYFYLISLLPNEEYLPTITVFITYSLELILLYRIFKKYELKKFYIVLAFIFIIFNINYLSVISGIRNMLAYSIFSYLLYMDLIEKRKRMTCFVGYFLLCLFHNSIIILVLMRIVISVCNKNVLRIINILCLVWNLFLPVAVKILELLGGSYFSLLAHKIDVYYKGVMYSENLTVLKLCTIILISIIILFFAKNSREIEYYNDKRQYIDFIKILIFFSLGSIKQYDLFVRMVEFCVFASPYYILSFYDSCNKIITNPSKVRKINMQKIIVFTGIIILSSIFIYYYCLAYKVLEFSFN